MVGSIRASIVGAEDETEGNYEEAKEPDTSFEKVM